MRKEVNKILAYFSELLDYFRALLILTDKYIEEYKTISPQLILRYSKKLTKGKIRLSSATSKESTLGNRADFTENKKNIKKTF